MKKIFALLFVVFSLIPVFSVNQKVFAEEVKIQIIPKSEVDESTIGSAVKAVGESKDGVWKEYNSQSKSLPLGGQFSSGIMNWDTLLNYAVYVVKFLFQLGLFLGAVMLIYAGYVYAMGVFGGKGATEGANAIKRAVIGSLVVLFSYAIVKILTSMFL